MESREGNTVASLDGKSVDSKTETGIAEAVVTVAGHRVRYLRSGAGPPVVLVHGLVAHSFSWRSTIPALAQDFTVYAPDLLGTGYSERVPGLDCSMGAAAARLIEYVDALALREFDLAGTSHGGGLATIMAASLGTRIRKLVLVAAVNPWSHIGWKRTAVLSTAAGGWLFRKSFLRLPALNEWVLRRLFADTSRIAPGTLEGYLEPLKAPGSADYLLGVVRCWHRDVPALAAYYGKISVPTLLVWGDCDAAVDPKSAYEVQRAIQGSELVMMNGVGHVPYEESPEDFNRVLLNFLQRK